MRGAAAGDLDQLRNLARDVGDAPQWPDSSWDGLVNWSERVGYLAQTFVLHGRNHELCGWVAGVSIGTTAELEFLVIASAKRRLGLGSVLLQRWMRWAGESGAKECLLEVRSLNLGAIELYCRLGFVEIARRKLYYKDPPDTGIVMRRQLDDGWSTHFRSSGPK